MTTATTTKTTSMPASHPSIGGRIAAELGVKPAQVAAAVALLDEGSTVPFIARYRKEATGGLDDVQLRALEERLEDLYAPYKPKRRTKAQIAREAGLDVLAQALLADAMLEPEVEAAKYLRPAFETENGANPGVADVKAALEGARHVLMEQFAEDAELVGGLREYLQHHGVVVATVVEGKEETGAKFRDYFAYSEPYAKVAPHRALALFRGRNEEVLRATIKLPEDIAAAEAIQKPMNACELRIAAKYGIAERGRKADAWLVQTARWTWSVKLAWQLESELFATLREAAEAEAIRVFATNLHDLLLAAPAGNRVTMGLDPGLRPHRQAGRHRDNLSARAAQRLGRGAAHARAACEEARRRAREHRQRHGFA